MIARHLFTGAAIFMLPTSSFEDRSFAVFCPTTSPSLHVPFFISLRIIQKAATVVTNPITITSGMLASITLLTGIPAASAVSLGAP
ncbi:hypothetical protein D3C73_1065420 [compost metagenome]